MTSLSDAALSHLRTLGNEVPAGTARYAILEELGRGGMGVVYRARDAALGRDVALKVTSERVTTPDRLEREARVLATLEHPGIVPVHDVGVMPDGRAFYAMQLVQGKTLRTHFERGMPRGDALRAFLRVCEAVSFAHAREVVHRDLKPGNVMLGAFGEVLVLDWGVARVRGESRSETTPMANPSHGATTRDGAMIGTPGYMAPEQAGRAAQADARSDIYALGRILNDILKLEGDDAPRPLRSIVTRATAAEPAHRYPSVAALADDVRAWLDGFPVHAHRESLVEWLGRHAKRHRMALSLIGVYVVVRYLLIVFFGR